MAKSKFKPTRSKSKNYNLAKIKVIGVGGAGGNAISRMADDFPRSVDFIAVNTDVQDLNVCNAKKKIYIGKNVTKGLGTGMNPELGRQAAEENRSEISDVLKGADMIFITAGFGGGTGTGAAPIIAETAKKLGILTVAVITKPFSFEGAQRNQIAQEGLMKIQEYVDTLITIPNDKIFFLIDKNTSLTKAFEKIDEVLKNAVQGVAELITAPGIINVDFADVKAVMQNAGSAIIGIGVSAGPDRAVNAANTAINSPLLETSIDGARGVLFSISGHRDLKMAEVNEVAQIISENIDRSAKVIFGTYHDRKLKKGEIKVVLVATGFDDNTKKDIGLLPGLFISNNMGIDDKPTPDLFVKEKMTGNSKSWSSKKTEKSSSGGKTDKKEKDDTKKKDEDIWDIPTFLRKKRK